MLQLQASSPSAQSTHSTDGLLQAVSGMSKLAAGKAALQQQKRSSWFSFKQMGGSSTDLMPAHRLSTEIHLDGQSRLNPYSGPLLANTSS